MLSSHHSHSKNKRGLTLSIGKLKKAKTTLNNQQNATSHLTAPCSPRLSSLFQREANSVNKNKIKFVQGYQSKSNSTSKFQTGASIRHKKMDQDIPLGGKKINVKPTGKSLTFYRQNNQNQFHQSNFFNASVDLSKQKLQNTLQIISGPNQINQKKRLFRQSNVTKVQQTNLNYFSGINLNLDNIPIAISTQLYQEKQPSRVILTQKMNLYEQKSKQVTECKNKQKNQEGLQQSGEQQGLNKRQKTETGVSATFSPYKQMKASSIAKLMEVQSRLDSLLNKASQARNRIQYSS